MGPNRTGARPHGRLLAALTALAVLLSWGADLPRLAAGALTARAAAVPASAASGGPSMEAPAQAVLVRAATLAVVPTAGGPATGLAPGADPVRLPRLIALSTPRPALVAPPQAGPGARSSRAPPVTAGT